MADRICLYTCPFTTRNQEIKTLEKIDKAIKQASRNESNDQAQFLVIKILDRRHSWKYRTHSGDYPLNSVTTITLTTTEYMRRGLQLRLTTAYRYLPMLL